MRTSGALGPRTLRRSPLILLIAAMAAAATALAGASVAQAGNWSSATQQAKFAAADGAADDRFGVSVAVDGDTAIVGAWFDEIGFNNN